MRNLCATHWIAFVLVFAGALNWGLIGAFDFNLVAAIFGPWPVVERIVYVLVGIAAIVMLFAGRDSACREKDLRSRTGAAGGPTI